MLNNHLLKRINKFIQNKYVYRLFWIVAFLAAWEAIARSGIYSPLIFPPLTRIIRALCSSIVDESLLRQSIFTLKLIFVGFTIALSLALFLVFLAYSSKILEGLVETLLAVMHPLPGLALLPLIILWLGVGTQAIVFIIVHSVVWPLLLNLHTGFKSIPVIYKQVGQNYELSSLQIVWHIMMPASLPYLLAGVRIGWARAWRAVIGAEMVFGAAGQMGGVGWFIFKKRVFMDTAGMFAGLIAIIIIGIVVEELIIDQLEKRTVRKWGMTV